MTINVLHYDLSQFDIAEINEVYNHVKEQLPNDSILIAIPQGIDFEQYELKENYDSRYDTFST